ncbi:MAG: hypothetical protein ACRC6B_01320, partial [Fusobacteriaceae bacterium]
GKEYEPCRSSMAFVDKVLFNKSTGKTKAFLIKEHEEILQVLEDENIRDCKMYNIDFHHDITYGNNEEDEKLSLENWVMHGRKEGLIDEYSWITQDNAIPCVSTPIRHEMISYKDLSINKLPVFDIIVICISKHFTPVKHWNLAYKILDYLNKKED